MVRFSVLGCAFLSSLLGTADGQQVHGVVVDPNGAAIGGADLRLFKPISGETAFATAMESGEFRIVIATPGTYVLLARRRGFQNRRVTVVVPQAMEAINVGNIRLNVAGCDAPGVICDYFGGPPPDWIVSQGYLQVRTDCMLAFKDGKVVCPDDREGASASRADIRVTQDESGVYLSAMNGATLAEPDLPRGDCQDAHPKETRIRIDGLGPGDDICLYTHDRHWSHVFPTEDVTRDSRQIAIWHVTRKR
jgi:Carboxypeptidase regulatory-like domain